MNTEQQQNQQQQPSKFKEFFKKIGMRNLVVICAVLLIGTAVLVNYILYNDADNGPSLDVDIDLDGTNFDDTLKDDPNTGDYFAQTALSRQQARDEALEVLQTVAQSENALPEAVQSALNDIAQIAKDIENESNIETLVEAKGFEDCIAVISDGKATVIVQTDGLLASEVAQINEIVYEQSGIMPTDLKIIEKK
ncbi:MAG: SpoIIIAH-like family protein [Clostridia bacterium]|nr:SpoIIIAH-like family protein [Clostridia bacterium]MBP3495328.1 SpoIIIAH-like family protein [Clostridia bacterium]MBQ7788224.1 SpoIIIAH-like family protein [Clostridia bacterium]